MRSTGYATARRRSSPCCTARTTSRCSTWGRRAGRASPQVSCGALKLDPVRRTVHFRNELVELSAREFAVLEALMREPGAVVSRAKLEDSVYGWGEEIGSNSVEVHLHHLRKKLDPALIRN